MWQTMRRKAHNVSNVVKLRDFQYRVMSNRLTTNLDRYRMNKEVSPLCSFCGKDIETTVHVLYNCVKVKKIWDCITRWVRYILKIDITLTKENIVLNNYQGQNMTLINTFILVTKQKIYADKCQNRLLNFTEICKKIHECYLDETYMANLCNKKLFNHKKWLPYIENVVN